MPAETIVRMGELVIVSRPTEILTALGLGSCIGICAYDPQHKIAGMAHVVLPAAVGKPDNDTPAKSADIGVPNLFNAMARAGADIRAIQTVITGGAQLFAFKSAETRMDIGNRNIEAVKTILASMRIKLAAEDVGGRVGRTTRLHVDTGLVTVRRVGEKERALAELGSQWNFRNRIGARAA